MTKINVVATISISDASKMQLTSPNASLIDDVKLRTSSFACVRTV